ncbi:pilus assembly protein PilM [Aquisalimonas sp. 2447]|uniref:pilus assembly protein PilM n=1 Tax=Aquisalimonas sp. 2447 TaxID=2740807 RepID=UPI001432691C|nr:pilus assembly protein PilM [Aquisalimonas sp. 2447]QIT53922.1 pilus assembly protein PilM [Aquisalimonas sp. 2447]
MGLFRKKSPPLLGIDISSTAIKLLELKGQDGKYRVESYAVEPLPANAVVEKSISDIDAVSEAIKAAVKRSRTKLRSAALAVPGSAAISKTIAMPADLGEQELEAQIELQADQYVPYPLDEVNLDFQVMGASEGENNVDVLLVASRSDNVESRVDACEAAGITPRVMDVESYATETAFSLLASDLGGQGRDQAVAVVDVGATMTTLTVLEDRQIIYTREQVFGGRQLTEEIQRRYGLSFEEAGRAKRQGGLPDSYEEEVLEPFKHAMAQQVVRSLQFFYGASQHNTVDALLLAGGCAVIPGVAQLIEEETGVPTQVANPFANMAVSSRIKPERLSEDAPALIIACGLAMRSFDA